MEKNKDVVQRVLSTIVEEYKHIILDQLGKSPPSSPPPPPPPPPPYKLIPSSSTRADLGRGEREATSREAIQGSCREKRKQARQRHDESIKMRL